MTAVGWTCRACRSTLDEPERFCGYDRGCPRKSALDTRMARAAGNIPAQPGREEVVEAMARIIDPDAWHESLPTDGCGLYWAGRRKKAKERAQAALSTEHRLGRKVYRYTEPASVREERLRIADYLYRMADTQDGHSVLGSAIRHLALAVERNEIAALSTEEPKL